MKTSMFEIIDGLHGKKSTQFGQVAEGYKTIAGVTAEVDKDGKVVDEKAKKKIEQRIGKKLEESGIEEEMKIVNSGKVKVKKAFTVKEFDEDDGWVEIKIKPGEYDYQVVNFRGWKPRQLKINGAWVDVAGDCKELEDLLLVKEGATIKDFKYHIYVDRGDGKPELASWYNDKKAADKEANFMKKKGYKVEVKINEDVDEDKWVTIKGTHVLTDDNGDMKNDKLKKKIEATSKSGKKSVDAKKEGTEKSVEKDYKNPDNLEKLKDTSPSAKKYGLFKSGKENGRLDSLVTTDDIDKEAANKFLDDVADRYDHGKHPTEDEKECFKALLTNLKVFSKEDRRYIRDAFLDD
jgi:hypothetical protein